LISDHHHAILELVWNTRHILWKCHANDLVKNEIQQASEHAVAIAVLAHHLANVTDGSDIGRTDLPSQETRMGARYVAYC